jgi:chromosome segregation protein
MRIKRVEIIGFKSFCDRAVVTIDASIIAVVGPNGCGKSNIVDAIRWCMGEQSAKHLRGKAMEDVIFAGSETRGPAPMAEVSLTFDDVGFSHETLEMAMKSDVADAERALDALAPDADPADAAATDAPGADAPAADAPAADAEAEADAAAVPAAVADADSDSGAAPVLDEHGQPMVSAVAQVHQLLSDDADKLDFSRYTEVTITRRLFRDGTSQYFINKTACRLRDVTDFFLGTGVGTKAYSIIEQGRIGQIVSARPQDRRAIIEEAAGITKFKAKKKAAERKLDQTRQNLLRVSDIVDELDKRMGTLRRQAQKAERYRKYKTEMKDLELWRASHRYLELHGEEQLVRGNLEAARTQRDDARAAFDVKDAHVVAERAELSVEERRLAAVQEVVYDLDNRLRLGESKIGFERREADELDARVATAERELEELGQQKTAAELELAAREEELGALRAEVAREDEDVANRDAAAGEARAMADRAQLDLERARVQLSASRSEISSAEAQLAAVAARREEAEARRATVGADTEALSSRMRELERELRRVDGQLTDARQTRLDLGGQQDHFVVRAEALAEQVGRGEAQVETLRTEAHRRRSRLVSLVEIQERYEGFARGTRAVMQQPDASTGEPGAVRGLVADVLRAPETLEVAVEAALGDQLGGVLVRDAGVGVRAIGYLKSAGAGRSAFVPMHTTRATDTAGASVASASVFARTAAASDAARTPAGSDGVPASAGSDAARTPAPAGSDGAPAPGLAGDGAPAPGLAGDGAPAPVHAERSERSERSRSAPESSPTSAWGEDWEGGSGGLRLSTGPFELVDASDIVEDVDAPTASASSAPSSGFKIEVEDRTQLTAALAAIGGEGIIGRMTDLVEFEDGYESVGEQLLAGTVVVDTLERAVALHGQGVSETLVTLDGDVVDARGVVSGGSREAKGAGVLAQKREIRELEEIVASLEHDLAEATATLVSGKAELKQLTKAIEGLRGQVHQGDLAIIAHEKDHGRLKGEIDRLRDRLGHLSTEQLQLDERLAGFATDDRNLRARRDTAAERIVALEAEQGDLTEAVASGRERLEALTAELTAAKIRAAQLGEKRASTEAQALRLAQSHAALELRADKLRVLIGDSRARAETLRASCEALAVEVAELAEKRRAEAEVLDAGRKEYERRLSALTTVELEARELRGVADRAASEVGQLELRTGQIGMNRQVLVDGIAERHQLDLPKVIHEYHLRPMAGDVEEHRVAELKDLIDRMGTDINLTAIDEFAEVSKRFDFLSTQKIDLESAVDQLQKAIDKINRTSRRLFKDTFHAVNDTFMKVFPRLFRGGQARLSLSGDDTTDLLEAGIEIMAQPPGKKNSTVDQLSGGEKALTAVALIFSIFLIKPSPFCILDEVDAPLDEANVDRYNEIVREMTDRSQFIVITHNKRTMESADNLYGVTMQEPGVSKLVTVNLNKLGATAA